MTNGDDVPTAVLAAHGVGIKLTIRRERSQPGTLPRSSVSNLRGLSS